jgi:hypothetical protein
VLGATEGIGVPDSISAVFFVGWALPTLHCMKQQLGVIAGFSLPVDAAGSEKRREARRAKSPGGLFFGSFLLATQKK